MRKQNVSLRAEVSPEQLEFLKAQNRNLSQAVRDVIERCMLGGDLYEDPEGEVDDRDPEIRFLEATANFYRFHKACEVAKVDPSEISAKLSADSDFSDAYAEARRRYIDDVEDLVIQAVKGKRKVDRSAMTGLIAWLNNNHPNWGRVTAEVLQRVFGPLFADLLKAVKKRVSPSVYKDLCKDFDQIRENRFLSFS